MEGLFYMATRKISVIVGSLRKGSFNRSMANALIDLAPKSLSFSILQIGDLPLYNEDLEERPPQPWVDFRSGAVLSDGFLFVTPEYNRSMPAAMKNALDVGSRPWGKSVWSAKPGAVISVSVGATGGFGANHHLRQSLTCLNVPVMQHPEAYIGNASGLFDKEGNIAVSSTRDFLIGFMSSFADWVARF